MTTQLAAVVADACKALDGWPDLRAPDGYPSSIALCVMDSIWSMGVRYSGVVNLLDRYRAWLDLNGRGGAEQRSTSALIEDVAVAGGPAGFADVVRNRSRTSTRNGILKSAAVLDAALALAALGIDSTDDLRARHTDASVESSWRAVRGQRSGISWHYLLILTGGVEDVKADRMIRRFVARAGEQSVTPDEAHDAVVGAYELLKRDSPGLTLRALDHAIWSAERGGR